MSTPLSGELAAVLGQLQRQHDILPFLGELIPAHEARLAPLPDEMLDQLRTSPDFTSIRPGEPVWLSIAGPDDALDLIVYRAEADGRHYVIARQG